MNIEFINEVRASMNRNRQSAINYRNNNDHSMRKISVQMALSKRRGIRYP
ncbi:hypothetical protein [Xenorhabdus budapestensis]|uniref:Uncharacterized protein n=1 Tax=Xenorhabdus budapestensis TaxID=290110 RepID=A0A2D0IKP0_XENBU|nr:hypothetical protein [Xenorhabdus budapestensis]PHM22349.1 hypothetical protein Xbud_03776 [Xenorhabdus budapestensis]